MRFHVIYNLLSESYLVIWEFECLELQHSILAFLAVDSKDLLPRFII